MGEWETEPEYSSGPAAVSLPAPQDTPYRTPSRASRRSRRSVTPSGKSGSPPPMPTDRVDRGSKRSSKDVAKDENISILDPRRFTPTLHANLVSEILALRRDQEEKIKVIESLESTLQTTKEEHDSVRTNLAANAKETRSLKRQLALLEGGTSSALSELARERDEAVELIADARKRLELTQKKIRQQEEQSNREQELWDREKDCWEEDRRKYERKIHVAETRLKVLLDEVTAFQSAHVNDGQQAAAHGQESDDEESSRETDAASVRTMSITNSVRFINGATSARTNGHSLADELNFDDEDDDQTDFDGRESALSNYSGFRHPLNPNRDSLIINKHRRNVSSDSAMRPASVIRGKIKALLETVDGKCEETQPTGETETKTTQPKPAYTDAGVQFSPPTSPKISPIESVVQEVPAQAAKPVEIATPPRVEAEIEANQCRKRVQLSKPLVIEPQAARMMVSAGSQTIKDPLSPPRTPQSPRQNATLLPEIPRLDMVSSCTQTDSTPKVNIIPPMPDSAPPPIPIISIQPPTSRPTTPREHRLPQHFKNFGCQVSITTTVPTIDAGVQTEGIQIDRRLALLPSHLQPSSITSRPTSPNVQPVTEQEQEPTPTPSQLPPRNPRRLAGKQALDNPPLSPVSIATPDIDTHDAYPGNNDNGPLSSDKTAPVRRPHRFSSLFAGFDTASSDDGDEFGEGDLSDSEYRTALSAPRPPSVTAYGPGQRSATPTVPNSPDVTRAKRIKNIVKPIITNVAGSNHIVEKEATVWKSPVKPETGTSLENSMSPVAGPTTVQAGGMRKAAMIQNGMTSSQVRSRSPSLGNVRNPPFPIPTRASSRKPPFTSSAPSDGQRSPTRIDSWHRRNPAANTHRSNSIRKVRSATALPRTHRYRRHGSRSPPPLSPSTEAPESPSLPRLPKDEPMSLRNQESRNSRYKKHRQQLSTTTDNTYNTHNTTNTNNTHNTNNTDPQSQAGGSQSTGVVDAIAQTMIGEWMFKYVRRRTSFGVSDGHGKDESNDRHKRWVWLAPYERSILWSSKQPSSGSALMGKSGRKLTIQSVLDVKDDNATPKGVPSVFNRSILILTPQRALKFTALSAERHYVWLTALSFLAHSTQAVPDIVSSPQPRAEQVQVPDFEPQQPKLKRGGIKDSIRIAKNRPGGSPRTTPSIPSVSSVLSSQLSEVASYQIPETIGTITSSHTGEDSRDAAEPPMIPRFQDRATHAMVHGRKRSNTGGHIPPPLSFRGFSGPATNASSHQAANSTANASVGTTGSSDVYPSQASSNLTWGMSQAGSQRTSEASSRPGNFFDAIGTVRMEAFISPLAFSQFQEYPEEQAEIRQEFRRRSKEFRRRRSRSRQRANGHYSRGTRATEDSYGGSRTTTEDDYFRDDPFRGF